MMGAVSLSIALTPINIYSNRITSYLAAADLVKGTETNLAELSPPDWSTSRQPSLEGLAVPQQKTAQGSVRQPTPGSQPTTVSADCECTSWRDGAERHYSTVTYNLTLLAPSYAAFLGGLKAIQLVKKHSAFYTIQKFITMFTKASQCNLFQILTVHCSKAIFILSPHDMPRFPRQSLSLNPLQFYANT
jgi:hypothetical protein